MKYIILENHPNYSRVKIVENGICQTLSTRMGTGGGNVPLVLGIYDEREKSLWTCDERERRSMDDS